MMIEHNHLLIQDIQHIRCVVLFLGFILYRDVLKVPDSIERGVAE